MIEKEHEGISLNRRNRRRWRVIQPGPLDARWSIFSTETPCANNGVGLPHTRHLHAGRTGKCAKQGQFVETQPSSVFPVETGIHICHRSGFCVGRQDTWRRRGSIRTQMKKQTQFAEGAYGSKCFHLRDLREVGLISRTAEQTQSRACPERSRMGQSEAIPDCP